MGAKPLSSAADGPMARRRRRLAAACADPAEWDRMMFEVAEGRGLLAYCKQRDIPFSKLVAWINEDSERERAYDAAMKVRGTTTVTQLESVLRRTVAGELDPRRAAVAAKGYQWLASVLDRRRYGEQTQVNVKHSISDEHLSALRGMVEVRQPQSAAPQLALASASNLNDLSPPIDAEFSVAPAQPEAQRVDQAPQPHDAAFYDV